MTYDLSMPARLLGRSNACRGHDWAQAERGGVHPAGVHLRRAQLAGVQGGGAQAAVGRQGGGAHTAVSCLVGGCNVSCSRSVPSILLVAENIVHRDDPPPRSVNHTYAGGGSTILNHPLHDILLR